MFVLLLTVTVFCILLETTMPSRVFRSLFRSRSISLSSPLLSLRIVMTCARSFFLRSHQDGVFLTFFADTIFVVSYYKCLWRLAILRLAALPQTDLLIASALPFDYTLSTRSTNRVLIPSFAAALLRAFCARSLGTPPTSKQDPSRANDCYPVVRGSLSFTHSRFSRFFGDRLVRKNADPHLTSAVEVTSDRHAACFDLVVRYPASFQEPAFQIRRNRRNSHALLRPVIWPFCIFLNFVRAGIDLPYT